MHNNTNTRALLVGAMQALIEAEKEVVEAEQMFELNQRFIADTLERYGLTAEFGHYNDGGLGIVDALCAALLRERGDLIEYSPEDDVIIFFGGVR